MKSRSPRFPFLPLEEAIVILQKLKTFSPAGRDRPFTRPQLLEACGYASFHGAAVKTMGALRAYDLLVKKDDGHFLSPVAMVLLDSDDPDSRVDYLQRAALSPLTFRHIWRWNQQASREEILEFLLERKFTESGAKRACKVYRKNYKFVKLRQLEREPELPDRGFHQKRGAEARRAMGRRTGPLSPGMRRPLPLSPPENTLSLPLSSGSALIPKGITEEEFQLLIDTLKVWKPQLVASIES